MLRLLFLSGFVFQMENVESNENSISLLATLVPKWFKLILGNLGYLSLLIDKIMLQALAKLNCRFALPNQFRIKRYFVNCNYINASAADFIIYDIWTQYFHRMVLNLLILLDDFLLVSTFMLDLGCPNDFNRAVGGEQMTR